MGFRVGLGLVGSGWAPGFFRASLGGGLRFWYRDGLVLVCGGLLGVGLGLGLV